MKLTTLLFGLLLAVGWTSNAQAQALPEGGRTKFIGVPGIPTMNAPAQAPWRVTGVSSAVHNKAYYQELTYDWTDDETGETHTGVDPTEPATNPYQIYELLRWVYMCPDFPGPEYSAYTPSYQREDPVYYGAIAGGWNIPGGGAMATEDVTFNPQSSSSYVYTKTNDGVTITTTSGSGGDLAASNSYMSLGKTTTISVAEGTITKIVFNGYSTQYPVSRLSTSTGSYTYSNNVGTWTGSASSISFTNSSNNSSVRCSSIVVTVTRTTNDENYYKPKEDGYTVLLVAMKDSISDATQLETEISPSSSTHFEQKSQLINYIQNNFEYVRLLTDGLRIGDGLGTGTVFNCDGRLNRFFFLGKGQARKKAPRILERIANGTYPYDWYGEDVPFEEMFEQFSPTSNLLSTSSQTLDLFDKLREGNVYNVVHDCGSVVQAKHEFSLSGRQGTEHFAFSGLNFFVPDYRLLYWTHEDWYSSNNAYGPYDVDGRDQNPYEIANPDYTEAGESHGTPFIQSSTNYSYWSCYYSIYNKTYAPKVGIYRITLDAVATQVGTSHASGNLNYNVTLTWVSSLNQMSGSTVPQTYTMYLVDENGNRTQLEPVGVKFYDVNGIELDEDNQNPFHVTQCVYAVPQNEHSYTIEYQVDGVADRGPAFHATSNRASVVIPGWNDFVGLQLNHHESDFVITSETVRHNWYRNFLAMVNEDIVNGLTVSKITGATDDGVKMNEFGLYRFLYNDDNEPIMPGSKVATITFDPDDEITTENPDQVKYKVTYTGQDVEQEIEPYTLTYKEGTQTVTVANAYNRDKMDILDEGYIRVKGNGDIVIWPNSYSVNIKSIKIYNGDNTTPISGYSWTAPSNMTWPVSPGSKWENYTTDAGDQVGYIEGGGYLYIPDVLDTYSNARVVIEAYGDAGNTNRLTVNDQTQTITATAAGTPYTWATPSNLAAPHRASVAQTVTESFEDENTFPSFGLGGITADNHTGRFGDWTLYDGTDGANVWGMTNLTWTNQYAPQAWMPFNGATVTQATAHTGNKYMESICPFTVADATQANEQYGTNYKGWDGNNDHWLISPELSGKEQTITFYASIFSTDYIPETFEVLYSTTDIDRTDFSNSVSSFTVAQSLSSSSTDWAQYSATLPAGAKFFAIRYTSNNQFGIMIDDVTYEISNELPAQQGGLLRLHLLMVDQLKAAIPEDNSHPDAYGYVLKWEQPENAEDHKQSGTVRVNIQKTDCSVESYYTLDEIDNDKNIGRRDENGNILHDQGLTMDVLTADVEFNLSPSNDLLNYYYLQGKVDGYPELNKDYLSQLHRQEDFTYREMLQTSPNFDQVYNNGEHHYFNETDDPEIGVYGDGSKFDCYAPSVSTWGIDRRYFEYDGLDNTYGAPIWKTAVGKAVLNSVTAERQKNVNNSVNWTTDAGPASLYILDKVEAEGYLPPSNLTKIEFEPYMFRIFVESKNGKLRPYKKVEAVAGSETEGEHLDALVPDDQLTDAQKYGPQCVWSGYVKYNEETGAMIEDDTENKATIHKGDDAGSYFIYNKDKVDRTGGSNANPLGEWDKDAQNAMFGALDAMTLDDKKLIIEDDLKFFVRFYFCVKGHSVGHTPLSRAAEADRPGNGAESEGKSGGSATAVKEITYVGEIVSQTYFNVQGMQSDKPFDGVNIVVTRFSDGTTSVSKVVK